MRYAISHDGSDYDEVEAESIEAALEMALEDVEENLYRRRTTTWVDVAARDVATDEVAGVLFTVEPEEPECDGYGAHEWSAAWRLVGGLAENPGVFGHGGGVRIHDVCLHCRTERIRDTWAEWNGQEGLESVEYVEWGPGGRWVDEDDSPWVVERLLWAAKQAKQGEQGERELRAVEDARARMPERAVSVTLAGVDGACEEHEAVSVPELGVTLILIGPRVESVDILRDGHDQTDGGLRVVGDPDAEAQYRIAEVETGTEAAADTVELERYVVVRYAADGHGGEQGDGQVVATGTLDECRGVVFRHIDGWLGDMRWGGTDGDVEAYHESDADGCGGYAIRLEADHA